MLARWRATLSAHGWAMVAILAAVLLGLYEFNLVIGFDLLPQAATNWRNPHSDMAVHTAGYLALLHEPWGFPPTVTDDLLAPTKLSIVYTDSIPWLALLLKAVPFGDRLNVLSAFDLISYVLQPVAMASLLWACGVRRPVVLFAGSSMALFFPPWIMRQFGHTALAGHWLILFSMAQAVSVARNGLTGPAIARFALLGALATGIHAYHLVPVSICAGAAIASDLLQSRGRRWLRALVAGGAYGLTILGSAYVLGYGVGPKVLGMGVLGAYSINLLGPFFPQTSAVFGQRWNGSWFSGYVLDPTGAQTFEGASFLGVGVLVLGMLAVVLALRRMRLSVRTGDLLRYGPLAVGVLVLLAYAIGPKPYVGTWLVADLTPHGWIADTLGIFRAHSRFFWAVGYAAIAVAVVIIDRTLRAPLAAVCATLALGVQAYDVHQLQKGVAASYAQAMPTTYPAAFWTAPQLRDRSWRAYPTYTCAKTFHEMQVLSELTLFAMHTGGDTNASAAARGQTDAACEPPLALRQSAKPGDRVITVVVDADLRASKRFSAVAARGDCYIFGSGLICGSDLGGVEDLAPAPREVFTPRQTVQAIPFDRQQKPFIVGGGWSIPETASIWALGPAASVTLPQPPGLADRPLIVRVWALSYAAAPLTGQRVEVYLNGEPATVWDVSARRWASYELSIPTQTRSNPMEIEFRFPAARSPRQDDPNSLDDRVLGMGVRQIEVLR